MSTLPRLHTALEIADALGVSEWWVKEQARQRRVPFVKVGGAYRFTSSHLDEIVAAHEQRPEQARQTSTSTRSRRRAQPSTGTPVAQLRARRPRRPQAGADDVA